MSAVIAAQMYRPPLQSHAVNCGIHLATARYACDTAWHEQIGGGAGMANAMLDARQERDCYRRAEVITGERRRRRWTGERKPLIVVESLAEM